MGKDVFISYARKDYMNLETKSVIPDNIIIQIKDLLSENNISFWFDEEGIYSGDAFAPVIAKNIKESKIFLFISSKNSNESEWTSGEVATARMYNKKIIPIKIDGSKFNDSVILHLAHLDFIDCCSHPQKELKRLLASIQSFLIEEERRKKENEAKTHSEELKREKEKALSQIHERMESVRKEREVIFMKLKSAESEVNQVRQELDMIDSGYNELRNQEAALLDDNFEQRKRLITSGEVTNQDSVENMPVFDLLKKVKPLLAYVVSMAALVVLLLSAVIFLICENVHKSDELYVNQKLSTRRIRNLEIELQTLSKLGYEEAVNYLDSHDKWICAEMEAINGLEGVWNSLNGYDLAELISYRHLVGSSRFSDLMLLAREIIEHKGGVIVYEMEDGTMRARSSTRIEGTYCQKEDDNTITYDQYKNVFKSQLLK